MYTIYIMRRTQIYLDPRQSEELGSRARRRGETASYLIREAIDEYLAEPKGDDARRLARYQSALDESFGAVPRLPDGRIYIEELRRGEGERMRLVENRRNG
jgi:hypothetical protein